MAEAENGFSVPEIELIIKASTIDGRRKGACIFCQEYFMDLYLLAGNYLTNRLLTLFPDVIGLPFFHLLRCRAEDHLTEDHHSWHEEATRWLQVFIKPFKTFWIPPRVSHNEWKTKLHWVRCWPRFWWFTVCHVGVCLELLKLTREYFWLISKEFSLTGNKCKNVDLSWKWTKNEHIWDISYHCEFYFLPWFLKTFIKGCVNNQQRLPPAPSSLWTWLTRSNFEAAQPPILIDNGVAVLENEKIERHIMKNIPGGHNLFISDNVGFLKKLGYIPQSTNIWITGGEQKDWECLLQVQAHAAEEGWHQQECHDFHPHQVSWWSVTVIQSLLALLTITHHL